MDLPSLWKRKQSGHGTDLRCRPWNSRTDSNPLDSAFNRKYLANPSLRRKCRTRRRCRSAWCCHCTQHRPPASYHFRHGSRIQRLVSCTIGCRLLCARSTGSWQTGISCPASCFPGSNYRQCNVCCFRTGVFSSSTSSLQPVSPLSPHPAARRCSWNHWRIVYSSPAIWEKTSCKMVSQSAHPDCRLRNCSSRSAWRLRNRTIYWLRHQSYHTCLHRRNRLFLRFSL